MPISEEKNPKGKRGRYKIKEEIKRSDGQVFKKEARAHTKEEANDKQRFLAGLVWKMAYRPEELIKAKPQPSLADFFDEFCLHYKKARKKPGTLKDRFNKLKRFILPLLGKKPLDSIDSQDFDNLKARLDSLGVVDAGYINGILATLSVVLRVAKEKKYISTVPTYAPLRVDPREEPDYLQPEELNSLIKAAKEHSKRALALVLVAADCGLRIGELSALRWEDIQIRNGRSFLYIRRSLWRRELTLPKGGKFRWVPLSERALLALQAMGFKEKGIMFPTRLGSEASYPVMRQLLHLLCKRAELRNIGWHALRHTCFTRYALANVPVHVVQKIAGHAKIETTLIYFHASEREGAEAVVRLEAFSPDVPLLDEMRKAAQQKNNSADLENMADV
jgi:integrase